MPEQVAQQAKKAQRTLRQIANRNVLISLVLFVLLLGQVIYAFERGREALAEMDALRAQQIDLLRFELTLGAVFLPINDYAITRNEANIPRYREGRRRFDALFTKVRGFAQLGAKERKALDDVQKLMQEIYKIGDSLVSGKVPAEQMKNLAVVAQSLVFVVMRKLDAVSGALERSLAGALAERQDALRTQAVISLVLIVLNIAVLVWLSRRFVGEVTEQIAGVAEAVVETSDEIMEVIDHQAMVAELQAKSVSQTADEIRELTETAAKVAATSANVEKLARLTASSAQRGAEAVERVVAAMQEIRDEMRGIEAAVEGAEAKVRQILDAIAQVQEIADETHLLALNASIESAAAGEFGKRFAVVANEVRKLADRTTEFTEQIQGVIADVRAATESAVQAVHHGLDDAEQGAKLAREAGEVLAKMREMSERTEKAVRMIARATQQQNEANQGFLSTMEQIRGLIEDSTKEMQRSRDEVLRLVEMAEELSRLVGIRRGEAPSEALAEKPAEEGAA